MAPSGRTFWPRWAAVSERRSDTAGRLVIGIDASRGLRGQPTGTEGYARQITRHLLAQADPGRYAFRLYAPAWPREQAAAWGGAANVRLCALPGRRMWTHRALARELRQHPPDVLFVPAHVLPFWPPGLLPPAVVTLHDVGYRYFPRAHPVAQRLYLDISTRWSAAVARRVIAISQQTAGDLERFYDTPPGKIAVIHEAPIPRAPAAAESAQAVFYQRRFGLYVGTIQPRKNLLRLIEGFERLVRQARIGWDLVLVGRQGWLSDEYQAIVAAKGLSRRVHFPGYLPDAEVAGLMRQALFFAFPSLFEGFGLPVLEAQTIGVPVMCANNSALPEIAGDAALLVDPLDVDAIAQAMLRLSQDEALRQVLIARGYENVKRFSWQKAAGETLAVLEAAAEKNVPGQR